VHARGTARHDDAIQTLIADGVPDDLLPWLRAHVDVIGAVGNTFDLSHLFGHRFDIDGPSDIDATMADKNAQPFLHSTSQWFNIASSLFSACVKWNIGIMEYCVISFDNILLFSFEPILPIFHHSIIPFF
jgi:hypothetical protein